MTNELMHYGKLGMKWGKRKKLSFYSGKDQYGKKYTDDLVDSLGGISVSLIGGHLLTRAGHPVAGGFIQKYGSLSFAGYGVGNTIRRVGVKGSHK